MSLLIGLLKKFEVEVGYGSSRSITSKLKLTVAHLGVIMNENEVKEFSCGGILISDIDNQKKVLLIKVRHYGYEIPKGHIEEGETRPEAAERELKEETSLLSEVKLEDELGFVEYSFTYDKKRINKTVHYFLFSPFDNSLKFGEKPLEVKEINWFNIEEIKKLPLVNEKLRELILKGFKLISEKY